MCAALSDAHPRRGHRTSSSRRSPSPAHLVAVENGLTKLSLLDNVGAVSKHAAHHHLQRQPFKFGRSRHPSDSRRSETGTASVGRISPQFPGSASSTTSMRNASAAGARPKKSLSFSDSYLVAGTSAVSSSSSSSGGRPKAASASSLKTAIDDAGRTIHVILPGNDGVSDSVITTLDELKSTASEANATPKSSKGPRTSKEPRQFETYMRLEELQQGLKRGELLEGVLRINPKNYKEAFISVPGGLDICLGGILDRNRALNGDLVVVKLNPREEWKILINDLRSFLCRNFNFSADAALLTSLSSGTVQAAKGTTKSRRKKRKHNRAAAAVPRTTKIDADAGQRSSDKENVNWASWEPENASTEMAVESFISTTTTTKIRRKRGQRKPKGAEASCASVTVSVEQNEPKIEDGVGVEPKGNGETRHVSEDDANADDRRRQEIQRTTTDVDISEVDLLRNVTETDSARSTTATVSDGVDDDFATLWRGEAKEPKEDTVEEKEDGWSRAAAEAKVAIIQLEDLVLECGRVVPSDDDDDDDEDAAAVAATTAGAGRPGLVAPDELSEVDDSMSDGDDDSCASRDVERAAEDARFFSGEPEDYVEAVVASKELGPRPVEDGVRVELGEAYFPGSRDRDAVAPASLREFLAAVLQRLATKSLERFTADDLFELYEGKRFVQPTGKVVYVTERKNSRTCRGYLRPMDKKKMIKGFVLFAPIDHRMPRMVIPLAQCPSDYLKRHEHYANTLFVARLIDWENEGLATGFLCRSLDEADPIENETEGFLVENGIDSSEFDRDVVESLPPSDVAWTVPLEESARRRDFRDTCVFTIDPATARDLDDAVSCDVLGDGLFHVGVHIADVAHFVRDGTALDVAAAQRATSVYLVQRVVPMLPRLLCENLCSLEPGVDRLAFSVEWVIRGSDAAILEEWFGHTVVRSCVKLSYDDAQAVIERGHESGADALPIEKMAVGSRWTTDDVAERVVHLHRLACLLRRKRSERGCLRLDQAKVAFDLDECTGLPVGLHGCVLRDSNRLIEEFMILANVAVARRIHEAFPESAVLRRHPPPQDRALDEAVESCKPYGIFLNPASAEALQESLSHYAGDGSKLSAARFDVLTLLLAKPMNCAEYFCNGCLKADDEDTWHYALNVPLYTHFTSPIRRYPDILVHRLLAATLDGSGVRPSISPTVVRKVLAHCNDMKLAAKRVGELSSELFLAVYIKNLGAIVETGMVCRVLDKSFDVLVLRLGIVKRIFCEQIPLLRWEYADSLNVPRLMLAFLTTSAGAPISAQQITMFSVVSVVLTTSTEGPLKINATLVCPTTMARQGVS